MSAIQPLGVQKYHEEQHQVLRHRQATDIGMFASLDAGQTWTAFNLGVLPAVAVFDIEQNQRGTIFIETYGRGVYQLKR